MRLAFLIALLALPVAGQTVSTVSRVDFVRDVRPILSSCFTCHGPDDKARMGKLRLDTREGAGTVIVAGDPAKSKLYQRVISNDATQRMPLGGQLSNKQIETVRAWIAQGAPWEQHWSFVAPVRPPVPVVKHAGGNPIDNFVQARLEKEGLHPAPLADKRTLIRRVTLDLTGLPPSPVEVDAFVADRSANAYEKVVDRLLRSPHYGERMAMQWLDLARYADTHGYHIDSHRDMWPWRDWVIDAYNRNLPFDKFTVWQVAGDLLPNPTREQRLATGFNRNHMINYEGGAIPEEYLVEYAVDRVEATSTAWLGLTMGCARCHDHKYDPIKQKDFYRFFAFFNNVADIGLDGKKGNAEPLMRLGTDEQERRIKELDDAIKALDNQLSVDALAPAQTAWEKTRLATLATASRDGLVVHYEFDGNLSDSSGHYQTGRVAAGEVNYSDSPVGRSAVLGGEGRIEFGAPFDSRKPFSLATWIRSGSVLEMGILQANGFEMRFAESRPLPHLRRAARLVVRVGGLQIQTREPLVMSGQDGSSPWHHYVVSYDGSGQALGLELLVDGKSVELEKHDGVLPEPSRGPLSTGSRFQGQLDDLRIYNRMLGQPEIATLAFDEPIRAILWSGPAAAKRTSTQKATLRDYFLTRDAPEELRRLNAQRSDLRRERQELEYSVPTAMVMAEKEKPRDTFLLARGDYRNQTEKVSPGVPSFLPALHTADIPEASSKDGGKAAAQSRLSLARWLVDPANPLTARVAVNRYWQSYFGIGLVKTSEDFGTRGELPSHPELLDWLATEFVRSSWDVRAMQRLIVTSMTYRQSSRATPAAVEKDPENRLLARGPRYRLSAETIRDTALAASGLLNEKIGGKSVAPYQPAGLWEETSFGDVYSSQYYAQDHGDALYRRSMYTFWKRTSPPPALAIFDAPDREKCVARRSTTNTPLQALVLMNDPTYVEAARALAARVMSSSPSTAGRIRMAFRLAASRDPEAAEQRTLEALAARQLNHYREHYGAALALFNVGESRVGAKLDKTELAAWTTVAQVILSLDETISKD